MLFESGAVIHSRNQKGMFIYIVLLYHLPNTLWTDVKSLFYMQMKRISKVKYNDKILAYYFVNTFLRSFNIFNKVFLVYLSLVL